MKNSKTILAMVAVFTVVPSANADDITGDFKVNAVGYVKDVASVAGSENHGAKQSGKQPQVEFTYTYTFTAEKEELIPGETVEILVWVPPRCMSAPLSDSACYYTSGPKVGQRKTGVAVGLWEGRYEKVISTTPDQIKIVTITENGSGLVPIYEPIVVKGRINPRGKLTGYDWSAVTGIAASPTIVDPSLVPPGYVITSVVINTIDYRAYLIDKYGVVIPDTVISGRMHTAAD